MDRMPSTFKQLPPRLLPILYFATAHVALVVAFAAVVWDPRAVIGFYYHPWMLGIVHLVTLGWITASILGALYIVGPVALRTWLPAGWLDYTAFALVLLGIIGMVAHFWIAEYGGMAWSAGTVGAGILLVGWRAVAALRGGLVPAAVRAHIVLAFVNIAVAATTGVLIGIDKVHPFLPGFSLATVLAHAHLAAIGWASMMVVGVAYRLLPMVLPSQVPSGRGLWASAVLLEAGAGGLFVSLLLRSRFSGLFACVTVSGFAVFLAQVRWMRAHARPRPPAVRMPDPAVLHAAASLASLAVASAMGLWLAFAPTSPATLRLAPAYGVFGLLGFLAQLVVGMEGRLLPMLAWYWGFAGTGYQGPVANPHAMASRPVQLVVFGLWVAGVIALAAGLSLELAAMIRSAAAALLVATVLDALNVARILRHAYAPSSAHSSKESS